MRPEYKFHAFAIIGICAVVSVLYALIGPKVMSGGGAGGIPLQIDSATWGANCNPYISNILSGRESPPLKTDERGVVIPPEHPSIVALDNVLQAVRQQCAGQSECTIRATSDALGVEPIRSCSKKLEIRYRCGTFDRFENVSLNQQDSKTIECHEPPAKTPGR